MKNLEKFVVEYRTKKAPTLDEVEGQKPQEDPVSKNKVKWAGSRVRGCCRAGHRGVTYHHAPQPLWRWNAGSCRP